MEIAQQQCFCDAGTGRSMFEHFSKLLYNERAPPSLPELDEREVSGLTDEISIDEVIAATRHCKYGKAAGPDGIATDVIKDCSTILVWPLYYIFNFCFSNGVCPSAWLSRGVAL